MGLQQIATSGLEAADTALQATAHNIANADSHWFSRRDPVLVPSQSQNRGVGAALSGVKVSEIRRMATEFACDQIFRSSAELAKADLLHNTMRQVDALIGNEHSGLQSVVSAFNQALGQAEPVPESLPARQQILEAAHAMAARYHTLYGEIDALERGLAEKLFIVVDQIGVLTKEIARLNTVIRTFTDIKADVAPLHDFRDAALDELARLIDFNVVREEDQTLTLTISSGHDLVRGHVAVKVEQVLDPTTPQCPKVVLAVPGAPPLQAKGGVLGGIQTARRALLQVFDGLGFHAHAVSSRINRQQTKGVDLLGRPGTLLFRDMASEEEMRSRALAGDNSGDGRLYVAVVDQQMICADSYELTFTGSGLQYRAVRASDQQVFTGTADDKANTPNAVTVAFDGLALMVEGQPAQGDRFAVTPWRPAAKHIEVEMTNPENLAFASVPQSGSDDYSPLLDGPGDNSNLLSMRDSLFVSRVGIKDVYVLYSALQLQIANRTEEYRHRQETASRLSHSIYTERDLFSGVNLDEEATNLLRYQHLYQANAATLKAYRTIIDELLSVFA